MNNLVLNESIISKYFMKTSYQNTQASSNPIFGAVLIGDRAPTLLSIDSRDNRNVSSILVAAIKKLKICPKNNPGWAVDIVMILQELYYIHRYETTGLIIEGGKWVHQTAEKLAEKLTHLHPSTIARRLNFMVRHGLLKACKPKLQFCQHIKYYTFGEVAIALLKAVNPMVVNFAAVQNEFRNSCEQHNKLQLNDLDKEKNKSEKDLTNERLKTEGKEDKSKVTNVVLPTLSNESAVRQNSPKDKPILKVEEKVNKDMGQHKPQGDRYFGSRNNQRQKIRSRAKMDSAIGMSGFKDLEDLQECQKQLTEYFARSLDPIAAASKASWIIKAERQGERSPFVGDYLNGLAIGSWCKKEWEVSPGVIAPVFAAYLRSKLRRGEDTKEQQAVKVQWFLKDLTATEDAWAECKRIIVQQREKIARAKQTGQNMASLDIPSWFSECFRDEVAIEEAAETAEVLEAIATDIQKQIKGHQERMTTQANLLGGSPTIDVSGLFLNMPKEENKREYKSPTDEVDDLLKDPITRARGVAEAKKKGLPILLSAEGVAIGVDYGTLAGDTPYTDPRPLQEDAVSEVSSDTRDIRQAPEEPSNYAAHQTYTPEKIEKGSKDAWEAIKRKSKFFSDRKNI